jgi:hypothetical protein
LPTPAGVTVPGGSRAITESCGSDARMKKAA